MTALDRVLRELGREHRAASAPPEVERALRAGFRRRHGVAGWRWAWGAAAACAAGAFAGLLLWPPEERLELRVAAPKAPQVEAAAPKAPQVEAAAPKAPQVEAAAPKAPQVEAAVPKSRQVEASAPRQAEVRVARKARPRPSIRPSEPEPREIATDFFPLRPGPVLEPGEWARVVRARIPRRELLRFGLGGGEAMSMGDAAREVPADVLFGTDGTARAIRFVHVGNSVQGAR